MIWAALPGLATAAAAAVVLGLVASGFAATGLPARVADTLVLGFVSATLLDGVSLPARLWRLRRRVGPDAPGPRARPIFFVASLAMITLALTQLLAVPLPEAVTRWLIGWSESWTLTAEIDPARPRGAFGAVDSAGRMTASCLIRYSLVCHLRDSLRPRPGLGDADRLMEYLVPLKAFMVTQAAVRHGPRGWDTALTGVGYCDQVNGVAADVLAGEFSVSQTYCLHLPSTGDGHAIGRVWSMAAGHWLYYDLWGDDLVVFKIDEGGGVQYLARRRHPGEAFVGPPLRETLTRLYERSPQGWVLHTYSPTLGRRLVRKLGRAPTRPAPGPVAPVAPVVPVVASGPIDAGPGARFVHAYLAARLDHLFGRPDLALPAYRDLGRGWTGGSAGPTEGVLRRAAGLFAKSLEEPAPCRGEVGQGP